MSEFTFIHNISVASIRDYIITHRVDQGDTIVLSQPDFEHVIQDIRNSSDEIPDFPLKVLGVIITQDPSDAIPIGKVQIVKNEKL